MPKAIPEPTLRRLPKYYNIVCQAINDGKENIKSTEISCILNIDDTQVRKDIAFSGYVGKPKVGFHAVNFKKHLEEFLGFNKLKKAYIIGAGNLGIALAKYKDFEKYGLTILGLFDNDPHKIGMKLNDKEVYPLSQFKELVKQNNVNTVIITVPAEFAQDIVDFAIESGVKAFWNFAPIYLKGPENIIICNQDLAANFAELSIQLNKL